MIFPVHPYPLLVVQTFVNALLNTSAFICRLLDIVRNTLFPIIFVFILNLSCYMM